MRYVFLSSAFVLTVRGTLVLLLKYKAVSLIVGHISLVLDKINLHVALLIFKSWLMSSFSLCLKYLGLLQSCQLHCSGGAQHGWILALLSRYFSELNGRKFISF